MFVGVYLHGGGKGNIILKFITKIVQTCSLGVMNIFHGLTQEKKKKLQQQQQQKMPTQGTGIFSFISFVIFLMANTNLIFI